MRNWVASPVWGATSALLGERRVSDADVYEMNERRQTVVSSTLFKYLRPMTALSRSNPTHGWKTGAIRPLSIIPVDLFLTLPFLFSRLVTFARRATSGPSILRTSSRLSTTPRAIYGPTPKLRVVPLAPRPCRGRLIRTLRWLDPR